MIVINNPFNEIQYFETRNIKKNILKGIFESFIIAVKILEKYSITRTENKKNLFFNLK